MLSTYPPRVCGIATFTHDLRTALTSAPGIDAVDIVSVGSGPEVAGSVPEVVATVGPADPAAYRAAAALCNDTGYDAVCVQHEFGIFGGPAGRHVLEFADRVRAPVVTTAHTVLGDPPDNYRLALADLAAASARVIVLTPAAVPLLAAHGVDHDRIAVVPHGVQDVPLDGQDAHKAVIGLAGQTVVLTFGLLSRNKGIELVIDALPRVVAACPDVRYVVLGTTHPEVRRADGEEYRRWLEARVAGLGLTDHVEFRDRYVEFDELNHHLMACDVYVTPYQSREQITSGTLSYAVGMGCAVVSTPYRHAEDMLADGRGLLVPFDDVAAVAEALLRLLRDDELRQAIRRRARAYGRAMTWTNVGTETARLLATVVDDARRSGAGARFRRPGAGALDRVRDPAACARLVNLDHLEELTDDVGVLQHATHGVPDRRFGYTTDDQSRALVAVIAHHGRFRDSASRRLAGVYLSYLQLAQQRDGRFRNVMTYGRDWLDDAGSEDTLGQSLWALGAASRDGATAGIRRLATSLLTAALPAAADLHYPRAIAYALCGLTQLRGDSVTAAVEALAERLVTAFEHHSRPGWRWCDDALTYANTKIPEALLRAGATLDRPHWIHLGRDALAFVVDATRDGDHFDFVGNESWRRRGGTASIYAQQPIEAGYTAQACQYAYTVTGEPHYRQLALDAAAWLLGHNRLGVALYDPATGACADGLERDGASANAGAESVICAVLGLLAVAEPAATANAPASATAGDDEATTSRAS